MIEGSANVDAVYKYWPVADDYQFLTVVNQADWELLRLLAGQSRTSSWKPVRVRMLKESDNGRPLSNSDFPRLVSNVPVLSARAVDAIGPLFEASGELLPLDCEDGVFWAVNVTTVVDALDVDHSEVRRLEDSGRIYRITGHEFRPNVLKGLGVFKLPEMAHASVYLTSIAFKHLSLASLEGFGAEMVWRR